MNNLNSMRKENSCLNEMSNNNYSIITNNNNYSEINNINNTNHYNQLNIINNNTNINQNILKNKFDIITNIQYKLEYFGENGANIIKKTKTLSFNLKNNNYENLMNQNVIEDESNYYNNNNNINKKNKNNFNNNVYYNDNNDDVNNVNNLNNFYGNIEDKDKSNIDMLPPTSPTFARLNKKKH